MTKTIINLTLLMITSEIEGILTIYPGCSYQHMFSNPGTRQKLVSYVLSRMPAIYTVVDDAESAGMYPDSLPVFSMEQRHHIIDLIHQGIEQILQEDTNRLECSVPVPTSASLAPSSWFG